MCAARPTNQRDVLDAIFDARMEFFDVKDRIWRVRRKYADQRIDKAEHDALMYLFHTQLAAATEKWQFYRELLSYYKGDTRFDIAVEEREKRKLSKRT